MLSRLTLSWSQIDHEQSLHGLRPTGLPLRQLALLFPTVFCEYFTSKWLKKVKKNKKLLHLLLVMIYFDKRCNSRGNPKSMQALLRIWQENRGATGVLISCSDDTRAQRIALLPHNEKVVSLQPSFCGLCMFCMCSWWVLQLPLTGIHLIDSF